MALQEFYRMQQLIGSEADWAANDLVLASGEIGFAIQAADGAIWGKIGDGVSVFSALEYTVGIAAIPLTGTGVGLPVTGLIVHQDTGINKEFTVGIDNVTENDYVIETTGSNQANANVKIKVNGNLVTFMPDGFVHGVDTDYGLAVDNLVFANQKYVDLAVSGGVSATFIPLAGTSAPVTGIIDFTNLVNNKEYQFGVVEGAGIDNMALVSTGVNSADCSFHVIMNNNSYVFSNTGRFWIPDITFGTNDDLAAANKKFVDELRQDCIDAGVAIPAPV